MNQYIPNNNSMVDLNTYDVSNDVGPSSYEAIKGHYRGESQLNIKNGG